MNPELFVPFLLHGNAELIGHAVELENETLASFLEHTYVTSSNGYSWNCWGRDKGGKEICRARGNARLANKIAQPQPPDEGFAILYNNIPCARIERYLIDGVCHQAANRILFPAKRLVDKAKGSVITCAWFGLYGYGKDAFEWASLMGTHKSLYLSRHRSIPQEDASQKDDSNLNDDTAITCYIHNAIRHYSENSENVRNKDIELNDPDVRLRFLGKQFELMVNYRLGHTPQSMTDLLEAQRKMLVDKINADNKFLKNPENPEPFLESINDQVNIFLNSCQMILGDEIYATIFC